MSTCRAACVDPRWRRRSGCTCRRPRWLPHNSWTIGAPPAQQHGLWPGLLPDLRQPPARCGPYARASAARGASRGAMQHCTASRGLRAGHARPHSRCGGARCPAGSPPCPRIGVAARSRMHPPWRCRRALAATCAAAAAAAGRPLTDLPAVLLFHSQLRTTTPRTSTRARPGVWSGSCLEAGACCWSCCGLASPLWRQAQPLTAAAA